MKAPSHRALSEVESQARKPPPLFRSAATSHQQEVAIVTLSNREIKPLGPPRVVAEGIARELGRISLAEALELTILIGKKEPPKRLQGVAVRWLERYLQEYEPTLVQGGLENRNAQGAVVVFCDAPGVVACDGDGWLCHTPGVVACDGWFCDVPGLVLVACDG